MDGCSQAGGPHGSGGPLPCPGSSRGLKASGTLADSCGPSGTATPGTVRRGDGTLWDQREGGLPWPCWPPPLVSQPAGTWRPAPLLPGCASTRCSPGWHGEGLWAGDPGALQAGYTVAGRSEEQCGRRLGSSGPASLALVSGWSCRGTVAAPATRFTWWTPPAAPPPPYQACPGEPRTARHCAFWGLCRPAPRCPVHPPTWSRKAE